MVQSAKSSSEVSSGIGTERTCDLSSRVTITERWVAWDEGHSYTYEGFNIPLVKSAKNKWSVKTENGKTLLTTKSEIVLKGGIFGIILEPLMTLMSTKMGTNALAAFKYLVENGRPFEGKHSTLPKLPIAC
jgi:hypothetical protein